VFFFLLRFVLMAFFSELGGALLRFVGKLILLVLLLFI
jgi:hypothetical protein